ncbi:hypothetical protein [Prosthecobacter sp.]|uniref:hypothetical protein n=1 Tax=Prosthecobacter sp. TaxID=1965333 RepID=UPI001E05AD91|nr:hypothetical protein [Prosthecobacter sp.]MCB1278360.1 hypothetical protein [Prosthecobacter sp.]
MKTAWHFLILLGLICSPALMPAADRPPKPVVVGNASFMRSGTLLREKREVRVEAGQTRQEIGANVTDAVTRFSQRVNFVRRIIGKDAEEVQVRELGKECVHYSGARPPPNETTALLGKTLRTRIKNGHWDYELTPGKATLEESQLLGELAFASDLLEVLPVCIGTGSRKPGETWKTVLSAPRGNAYGWIVPDDFETTLVSVEDQPDGPHATFAIEGKFHMARPMDLNARMEVTFKATVSRRLSDMLDLDAKVTGQFVASAQGAGPNREKILLSYDYPFTLTRTLQIEGK